jgi:hypothetical protein
MTLSLKTGRKYRLDEQNCKPAMYVIAMPGVRIALHHRTVAAQSAT